MTTYFAAVDVRAALSTPLRCPTCGGDDLVTTVSDARTVFRCAGCEDEWVVCLGRASRLVLSPTR